MANFSFLVFFVLSISLYSVQAQTDCKALAAKGEKGIRKLILMEPGVGLPKTAPAFDEYCKNGKELYKGLREYGSCLSALPKSILETATKSVAQVLKKHCGSAEGRQNAIKVLNCASDSTVDEARVCAQGTLNVLEHIANKPVNTAQILPQMCCMAHMTANCLRSKISSTCDPKNVDLAGHFEKLVKAISNDVISLACDDYRTWAACEKKIPEVTKQLKEIAAQPSPDISTRKFVAPVIKIGEKITN